MKLLTRSFGSQALLTVLLYITCTASSSVEVEASTSMSELDSDGNTRDKILRRENKEDTLWSHGLKKKKTNLWNSWHAHMAALEVDSWGEMIQNENQNEKEEPDAIWLLSRENLDQENKETENSEKSESLGAGILGWLNGWMNEWIHT